MPTTPGRRHLLTQPVIRGIYSVVAREVRLTRGVGTRAARRAMTNRQDCRFAQPQAAPTGAEYKEVLRKFERLEHHLRCAIPGRRFETITDITLGR